MVTLYEVIWKSLLAYFFLLVLARFMGRKFVNRMTVFDFVVSIMIGTITATYVTKNIADAWVLVSPAVLAAAAVATSLLTLKSPPARKIIEGEPVVIVQNGRVLENNMRRLRYNLDDLMMQLRDRDIFDIGELEFAVMEPNGKLSVLKKSQHLPLTPQDLGLPTGYKGLASEIVKDGAVVEQNLKQNNLDFPWLYGELRKKGVEDISDVLLADLQTDGTLYVDLRKDRPGELPPAAE